MHSFASYVLRSYYKATGWNEDNLFANFTRSSNGTRPRRVGCDPMMMSFLTTSHPRLHRPSRAAPLHIKVPKLVVPDDVFHGCSSVAERLRRLHLHLL